MARLLGISGEQVDHVRPLFPKERGGKRVDNRKVLRGTIPVIQKGLRRGDALPGGPWSPQNALQPLPPLVRQGGVIGSFPRCQRPAPQSHPMPRSRRC